MDPVSVLGVAASALQIAQFIGTTIQSLHTLRGKFKDADTTIRLIISKLSTIKAAIFQIRDWAEFNSDDSPKERQFMNGLYVALDGCQAAIDVLSEEIKDLAAAANTSENGMPLPLGFRARAATIWSEDTMKAHEDRLHGQVQALQLLLMAGQCRDAIAQKSLLSLKENQRLIQKVADDTTSLRSSHSSAASQTSKSGRYSFLASDNESILQRPGVQSGIYIISGRNDIGRRSPPPQINLTRTTTTNSSNDEGYETGRARSESRSTTSSEFHTDSSLNARQLHPQPDPLPEMNNFNIYRSRSLASESTKSEPMVQRWLSLSSSSGESFQAQDKSPDCRKKRFWSSRLSRLNTISAVNLLSSSDHPKSANSNFPTMQRPKRGPDPRLNQSIDFSSSQGLQTPALVRAAQAGSGVEVQALLSNGHNIEEYHAPTHRTALAVAAHCGNSDLVDLLIQFNANLEARDVDSCTPLHLAASRDHFSSVQLLLQEDIDIEAKDRNGRTPLWTAAYAGHVRSAELLLRRGAKINARANDQCTALHAASKRGDRHMAELLLRSGSDIEARDNQFMTALHYACENGHQSIVDYLLQKGANIEVPGNNSKSPLLCASAMGHLQVVQFLSKKKPNPRSTDEKRLNALHWAARNGHVEVVNYLLEWKLPIHDSDVDGLTPLHHAVAGQHFGVVELLLRRNAALDRRCREGRTPLHYACGSDSPDIVSLLLSAGAQTEEAIRGDSRRPIHIAAAKGSVRIVEILYERGSSIDVRDSGGDRPLCIACYHGHTEVVERLLSYNEPLRMRFRDRPNKDSPLCIAAKAGHLAVVQLLIDRGASVKERDEFGYIPLRYAAYYGHPEVLELLIQQGAELWDEGEDSHGWGFLLMPATIGFSDATYISEDRKNRVRILLEDMERKFSEDRDNKGVASGTIAELNRGQKTTRFRPSVFSPRHELAGGLFRSELPASRSGLDLQSQLKTDASQDGWTSKPQSQQSTQVDEGSSTYSPILNDIKRQTSSSGKALENDLPTSTPVLATPNPLPSAEVAALIAQRQAEIQELQQYLPKDTTHTKFQSANTYTIYELPS